VALWTIDRLSIAGGFLSHLSLTLPGGLICIIGPRGSGKSTLAEAIRLVLGGVPPGIAKARADLLKANLGDSVITLSTTLGTERGGYTVRRTYGQTAVLSAPDGRPVTTIDLDRGTFLPLDAYSSLEIEAIADETLGSKRRALLDDLCAAEMQAVHVDLADRRRALDASADSIRASEHKIIELTERLEELGDVAARVGALPPATEAKGTPEFEVASKQRQRNELETEHLTGAVADLRDLQMNLVSLTQKARDSAEAAVAVPGSANAQLLQSAEQRLRGTWLSVAESLLDVERSLAAALRELEHSEAKLRSAHAAQQARYLATQQENMEAVKRFEERAKAEKDAASAGALRLKQEEVRSQLKKLIDQRKALKADHVTTRDSISLLREQVAARLQREAGEKVRIRVQRNADILEYRQSLLDALYGSKLKNQEDILRVLSGIRPEDLAQMLQEDDFVEFESQTSLGKERGRKVFDALCQHIDPLALGVLAIDDRVIIELNVATGKSKNFKDASELSRGQKCTALLPILLARRDTPLVIDQPEDNLDNHFIYETVVDSIRRLRPHRQMIFITHNANIPVLGEADLVIVMNSDGKRGVVERAGSVDQCRGEIIDLLEGGEEAFELRRKRYGS